MPEYNSQFFQEEYKKSNPKVKADFRKTHISGFRPGRQPTENEKIVEKALEGKKCKKS